MERFIYLADTHVGTNATGYWQQPAHPGRIAEILAALDGWICENGGVDFILHGGDMADRGDEETIRAAAALFRKLPVPVYCCLGNHDLTEPESSQNWLSIYPEAFPGGSPEYVLEGKECTIDVVPNHWGEAPYFWRPGDHTACWHPHQLERLEARYSSGGKPLRLLLTHSPVFDLPPEQTGLAEPLHPAPDSFAKPLCDWVGLHPEVAAVLGAHSHLNMRVERGGVQYVTASSLCEAPFEFKLFEAGPNGLGMRTVSLGGRVGFDGGYDASRAFVQGRKEDREFFLSKGREK